MSEENSNPVTEEKVDEVIPVDERLGNAFNLLSEYNTMLFKKDYSAEQFITVASDLISSIQTAAGIVPPDVKGLNETIAAKEKAIEDAKKELDTVTSERAKQSEEIKTLTEKLSKFTEGKFGKVYDERQIKEAPKQEIRQDSIRGVNDLIKHRDAIAKQRIK